MAHCVVHVLLIADRDVWVAQCIDYDLAAQAASPREAVETFKRVFELQLQLDREAGKRPLEGLPKPPKWYADRFKEAWLGAAEDGPTIPPPYMLQARVSESAPRQS